MSPIGSIRLPAHVGALSGAASLDLTSKGASSFGSVMADAVQTVDNAQKSSQASVERFLSGEGEELHHVALQQQQAAITFDVFLQVRNKVVQAYQEVMRMPI
jgi:flagellar hook-basal body complex protein FliE